MSWLPACRRHFISPVCPCRKHERKQPQVVGYDTALLDRWVSSQEGKLVDLEGVGAFGAALLGHEADAGGAGAAGGSSLVSVASSRWQSDRRWRRG